MKLYILFILLAPIASIAGQFGFECRADSKNSNGHWETTKNDLIDPTFILAGYSLGEIRYYNRGTNNFINNSIVGSILDEGTIVPDWYVDKNTGHYINFKKSDDETFTATLELSSRLNNNKIKTIRYSGRCITLK